MTRDHFIYILANHSRHLYTGHTRDLLSRMWKHKSKFYAGYTAGFDIHRLVYFESTTDGRVAIAREKQLKRWPRWRKLRLIEQHNPDWRDLSEGWFDAESLGTSDSNGSAARNQPSRPRAHPRHSGASRPPAG